MNSDTFNETATVSDLAALALRTNPAVCAARADWRSVVEKCRFTGAWTDPEAKIARRKLDEVERITRTQRLAARYRDELIPQAERAMEAARERLSRCLGSLRDFVEAQGAWYDLCLAGARAAADCAVLLARLEARAGRSLTGERAAAPVPLRKQLSRFNRTSRAASRACHLGPPP